MATPFRDFMFNVVIEEDDESENTLVGFRTVLDQNFVSTMDISSSDAIELALNEQYCYKKAKIEAVTNFGDQDANETVFSISIDMNDEDN